jgi:hypothetical protein
MPLVKLTVGELRKALQNQGNIFDNSVVSILVTLPDGREEHLMPYALVSNTRATLTAQGSREQDGVSLVILATK